MRFAVLLGVLLAGWSVGSDAAERKWQKGTWTDVKIDRPRFVIGVQPRPSGPASEAPPMTVIRTYAIETEDLRIELKEPAPPPRRPVDAIVGDAVTFALEKNTLYVRETDGSEHRLQVTKKSEIRRR
jgi:hypothetical protein